MKQLLALLIFGLVTLRLCYLEAETIKKFEFTSTLEDNRDGPCKSSFPCPGKWSLGKHFLIESDDPSIKGHMDKMVGEKVRIIVYTIE